MRISMLIVLLAQSLLFLIAGAAPASAQEGGELGWTNPGQMVPEFERTMSETEIGALSEPVLSQFGWHLLEVTGRRDQDMSELITRGKAREYLHQRKYQEELDGWLRRIRDEAFVDIK